MRLVPVKSPEQPDGGGWVSDHIGSCLAALMRRLGYERYVSGDGDCGWAISHRMALQNMPVLIGIHINMPGTVSMEIESILAAGGPPPSTSTDKETRLSTHRTVSTRTAPAMRHDGVRRSHQTGPAGTSQKPRIASTP
jgi:hypothetical protein